MFFHKDYKVPEILPETDDKGNVKNLQFVDQFDAQPFMMGENGFHRAPMSVIIKEEEEQLRSALLERLNEVETSPGFDKSVPVGDIIKQIIPRYVQTAASMRDYVGSMENGSIAKYVEKLRSDHVAEVNKINDSDKSDVSSDVSKVD